MAQILANDMYEVDETSAIDTKDKQKGIELMKDVNEMNWQYAVVFKSGKTVPINDFESMMVG